MREIVKREPIETSIVVGFELRVGASLCVV